MDNKKVKEKYNIDIKNKYGSDYEKNRWFKDDFSRSGYDAMFASIRNLAVPGDFATCLELGPGHGTWTNVLLDAQPEAQFDLIDISSEMLALVKNRFSKRTNINYFESDFLEFSPGTTYDFFFSSRAIEYINDKEKMAEKIGSLIKKDGRGFLITKTPKYLRMKLLGKKVSEFHAGQIGPDKLTSLLTKNNIGDFEVYPVTFVWPFWRSSTMNRFLYKMFGEKKMNCLSKFFSESYALKFRKI